QTHYNFCIIRLRGEQSDGPPQFHPPPINITPQPLTTIDTLDFDKMTAVVDAAYHAITQIEHSPPFQALHEAVALHHKPLLFGVG
ncbi:MAG: hypothetical protein ACKO6M_03185, partial [Bacteroidota bacterium]